MLTIDLQLQTLLQCSLFEHRLLKALKWSCWSEDGGLLNVNFMLILCVIFWNWCWQRFMEENCVLFSIVFLLLVWCFISMDEVLNRDTLLHPCVRSVSFGWLCNINGWVSYGCPILFLKQKKKSVCRQCITHSHKQGMCHTNELHSIHLLAQHDLVTLIDGSQQHIQALFSIRVTSRKCSSYYGGRYGHAYRSAC